MRQQNAQGESESLDDAQPTTVGPSVDAAAPDDDCLVARCRAGDERAFELLYRRHVGAVVGHLRLVLGPGADTADATQQVFSQAFASIERFEGRSQFRTWLFGITVRVALTASRTRGRRLRAMQRYEESVVTPVEDQRTPEREVAAQQQVAELYEMLEAIPAKKRLPFLLYYVEELELGEIATRVGLSADAAWKRIKRTRDWLLRGVARKRLADVRRGKERP